MRIEEHTEEHTPRPSRRLHATLAALTAVGATLALSFAATPVTSAAPATPTTSAAASETAAKRAADDCAPGWVCMWSQRHYGGTRFDWNPDMGNVFLGEHDLADNIASFISNASGCFQDSPTGGGRGDWYKFDENHQSADFAFGRLTDRIKPSC
ncbi:peptidase inhibitor family I36 protein [Streptomyces sp. S1A(2023)]